MIHTHQHSLNKRGLRDFLVQEDQQSGDSFLNLRRISQLHQHYYLFIHLLISYLLKLLADVES